MYSFYSCGYCLVNFIIFEVTRQYILSMYTARKCYWILAKQYGYTRSRHFGFLEMAGHQQQTGFVTLMQLWRVVLWRKNSNLQCPKLKLQMRLYTWYRNVLVFILRLNFPQLPLYHHYTVNLWHFCTFNNYCWHQAKFETNHWISIWALTQNGKRRGSWCNVSPFCYPKELLLHLYKLCFLIILE